MTCETRDLVWTPRDDTRYVYGVAVVRALESSFLQRKNLESMAREDSPEGALEQLGETFYVRFMAPDQHPEQFESILHEALLDTYGVFRSLVLDEDLENAVLRVHDFHNLKALLKAQIGGDHVVGIVPFGLLDPDAVATAVRTGNYGLLPPVLAETAERATALYQRDPDPQRLEIVIDRAALRCRIEPLARLQGTAISEYAATLADTKNLRLTVRMSRTAPNPELFDEAFTEGGTIPAEVLRPCLGKKPGAVAEAVAGTRYGPILRHGIDYLHERGSCTLIDRELEDLLTTTLRRTRTEVFGPGPVLAHAFAREHEVAMIRMIMVAKLNRIPVDRILDRLSMLYV